MVISEPGLICLESSQSSLVRGFVSLWFGEREQPFPAGYQGSERGPIRVERAAPPVSAATEPDVPLNAAAGAAPEIEESGLSDQALEQQTPVPLTAQERRARSAALRGLLLGRQRRFNAAQSAFAEAARLDPELKLESVPTFWDMERGAHEAAVRAYADAGRKYDASMLASRLRTTYRPRLLSPRPPSPSPAR